MSPNDRRRFQRLKLGKPLLGLVEGKAALVLDVGVGGAFVEHYGTYVPGQEFELSFRWRGEELSFVCEVARTEVVREATHNSEAVSHTGVRFAEAAGDSNTLLRDMMATLVGRLLAAQRANASGEASLEGRSLLDSVGHARRARAKGFVTYRLRGVTWSRIHSRTADQPEDGFTVAASEDEHELEVLCRAYVLADAEGRRMIRLVAELSAQDAAK